MRRLLLLLALVFWAAPACAQEAPIPLTLETTVKQVLDTHPLVTDYQARVAHAEAEVDSAWVPGRPTLTAGGNLTNDNPLSRYSTSRQAYNNPIANVLLTQTLATFGRLHFSVLEAEMNQERAREELRYQQDLLVDQTVTSFCAALAAEEAVAIARDTLKTQEEHLKDARISRQAGTVADFDVLRSEAAVSQAQRDLLQAENLRLQTRADLLTLLGQPVTQQADLTRVELPGPPPTAVEQELDEGLARRPDLRAVEKAIAAAEAAVGLAESQNAPTLELQSGAIQRNIVGFSPGFQWSTSLALVIPLYDAGNSEALTEQAQQSVISLRAQLEQARRQARLDIYKTYLDLKTRRETLEVAKRNVAQAAEAYRIAGMRYRFGLGTNVELLDAQTALTTARTAQVGAYYDYVSGWGHYQRVIGLPWPVAPASTQE